jgi:Catalytic LigB subunit of aromatic ring-opening dioxygenase
MGKIVLGLGTSHTLMLNEDPLDWQKNIDLDKGRGPTNLLIDEHGKPRLYDELVAERSASVAPHLTPESWRTAGEGAQRALDRLADALASTPLDAVIVIGDDQKELFATHNLPAMLIYCGETIPLRPWRPKPNYPQWLSDAWAKHYGKGDRTMPVAAALARHIIEHLMENEFDPAIAENLPDGEGEGHAFGFIHTRLMKHKIVPMIPVFLNTFYPPNQPRARRCVRLGEEICRAVASFPEDCRVAVVASGGLSHFALDIALDRLVIDALRDKNTDALLSIPFAKLQSGSSEILNWIAMHGAIKHLNFDWCDYFPGYRTPAGTGIGLAFGVWR